VGDKSVAVHRSLSNGVYERAFAPLVCNVVAVNVAHQILGQYLHCKTHEGIRIPDPATDGSTPATGFGDES
jgi:hypothetical protein